MRTYCAILSLQTDKNKHILPGEVKKMPHIHTGTGEFDYTVAGYIVHEDKTLLIKHKYLPIWTAPAGHIEVNQTPLDALYAEIGEEAGITREHLTLVETHPRPASFIRNEEATELPIPFDLEYHPIIDGHRHIGLSYVLISDTNHVEPGAGESNTFKWFTVDELRAFKDTNKSIISSGIFAIEHVRENQ
jgi:8-oxo-dGTP pyrophosphatase MutT (NUDIX family)